MKPDHQKFISQLFQWPELILLLKPAMWWLSFNLLILIQASVIPIMESNNFDSYHFYFTYLL